ncbi:MAG: sulfate adenylyltransferase [Candidatus Omnitrophica bacterium CG11_big_fil_rev_8_21_14_0_20_64_10]|nr:MAG: sulfate adenylyltransferase [Candidatus Omnitrophica bacterium CG11_big_fil_rev_8_21_14_0_20_64_10]
MPGLIPPHGGRLNERLVQGAEREALLHQAQRLPAITLRESEASDLELLAIGALSPLTGFLRQADYDAVVERMRLADETLWPVPIVLSLDDAQADQIREGMDLALRDPDGRILGVLQEPELYPYNKGVEAKLVFGAIDRDHPGVDRIFSQGPFHLGGAVQVLNLPERSDFLSYRMTPRRTRQEFERRGWEWVAGFQAAGPIHRAHEYLLRCALEVVDGLLIQPLLGVAADWEFPDAVLVRSCEVLAERYLPSDRVVIGIPPAGSRRGAFAREELFQAILRQNYGCSHAITGRDSGGLGRLPGVTDPPTAFRRISRAQLGITPLAFDNAFYCVGCGGMATAKTCPHPATERRLLSATALREMLAQGQLPPPELTRPEIADLLKQVPAAG